MVTKGIWQFCLDYLVIEWLYGCQTRSLAWLHSEKLLWKSVARMEQVLRNTLQWRHNGRHSVSNHQPHDCLLKRLFRRRSKKTSKLRVTGLCAGNSPGTGEFPAEMASNAENIFIWRRHHDSTAVYPIKYYHAFVVLILISISILSWMSVIFIHFCQVFFIGKTSLDILIDYWNFALVMETSCLIW